MLGTRTLSWIVLPVAVLCARPDSFSVSAQTPPGPPTPPTFRAESELVVLRVRVTHRDRGPVSGLTEDDFIVYEDNRPQTISVFSGEDVPVTVGLVVDSSTSMGPKLGHVMAGAMTFAATSRPDDEIFVVNFNEHVRDGLPADAPFTSDLQTLRGALAAGGARGRTALYDAVGHALEYAERGRYDGRVLVVLSDGGDNASRTGFDDLVAELEASDAVVYAVGLFSPYERDTDPGVLKRLASLSGGEAYMPDDTQEVISILERIARDIRAAYTIGYVSSNRQDDGRFRRLRVSVRGGGGDVRVRHREGYVPAPSSEGEP